jgi:hypothetical protein
VTTFTVLVDKATKMEGNYQCISNNITIEALRQEQKKASKPDYLVYNAENQQLFPKEKL